ncbi:TonB-dependent receptor [Sphingobium jiangsuense]|uniref:Iron complex outermembrane receptor protein n=1 Tax=Sphingobium jiangsuense TaxID=870476 RepID=A0A7W6FPY1_9SPHN|nr:TonB-dependent receptor [Sphingobium jiangsuense]MBB3926546.1 iron complex outermembrane receptor protein [Sphingobium jiangsuense]GLT01429.1 TonB-dependent receptor [Sphingobium jiangsuense]
MRSKLGLAQFLIGVSAVAMMPAAAQAQEGAAPADQGDVQDIVVTAQFRQESSQKAALSLDVLSADTLAKAGVAQATDIARIAPGVQITQGGTALQIYIRGAGDFSTTSYSNSAVAQNFDGVFAARTQYVAGTFFDLERVEVLKGPQGTLYGRNATGGALNIIPVQPRLGEFGGYMSAGFQNYNGFSAEGALNVPIGEKVALRASFQGVSRDGYISDGTDDDKHHSFRLQLKAEPNEDVTIRFGLNYQHLGGKGPGKVVYERTAPVAPGLVNAGPIIPGDRWTSINDTLNGLISQVTAPPGIYPIDTSTAYQDVDVWGVNAHLDWDLGPATLTVIPAYQRVVLASNSYPAMRFTTVNPYDGKPSSSDAQTLEVRLGNATDTLKWVIGGYFFNEDQDSFNEVRIGRASDTAFIADLNTRAYAVFGEATYSLTDFFRVTGGLRYTDETKKVDAHRYAHSGSSACPNGGSGPGGSCEILTAAGTYVQGTYSANRVNYKVGVEFDAARDSMLYASVVTGFKSGGQSNADIDPYKPEDVTAYTIGSKNRFFGRLVQLNAELFYMDYRDRQENFSQLDRGGAQVSSLFNAGKAVAKGASVDLTLRPTRLDNFRVAVEYVKSKYKDFSYRRYTAGNPGATTTCAVTPVTGGNAQVGFWNVSCDGFQLPRTPKWSGTVSYSHTFELANGGEIEFSPDMSFSSARWLSAEFSQNARGEAYALFNANLTYRAPDDAWSLQLFMRNIGDKAVYTGTQQYPFIANFNAMDIAPPRTYGARFRVHF